MQCNAKGKKNIIIIHREPGGRIFKRNSGKTQHCVDVHVLTLFHLIFFVLSQKTVASGNMYTHTLESGIDVGPTVINLAFFSRPYGLIRDYIKVI